MKHRRESLNKTIQTLIIKADELWALYGFGVTTNLKKKSQYYTHRSIDGPIWLPSMTEIVSRIYCR